jgi:hypothetical protein
MEILREKAVAYLALGYLRVPARPDPRTACPSSAERELIRQHASGLPLRRLHRVTRVEKSWVTQVGRWAEVEVRVIARPPHTLTTRLALPIGAVIAVATARCAVRTAGNETCRPSGSWRRQPC